MHRQPEFFGVKLVGQSELPGCLLPAYQSFGRENSHTQHHPFSSQPWRLGVSRASRIPREPSRQGQGSLYQIEKIQIQAQVDQAKANLVSAGSVVTNAQLQ